MARFRVSNIFPSLLGIVCLFASLETMAIQRFDCGSSDRKLIIAAEIEGAAANLRDASVKMQVKQKTYGVEGPLKQEGLRDAVSPDVLMMTGRTASGTYEFRLAIPRNLINKRFQSIVLSAYMNNPMGNVDIYPHRVSVTCRSTIK